MNGTITLFMCPMCSHEANSDCPANDCPLGGATARDDWRTGADEITFIPIGEHKELLAKAVSGAMQMEQLRRCHEDRSALKQELREHEKIVEELRSGFKGRLALLGDTIGELARMKAYEQFRTVLRDRKDDPDGQDSYEYGNAVASREAAEKILASEMEGADPPYDDGHVQHRYVSEWERCE